MLNAFRNFVECPDPLDGSVDEGARAVNRCEAATALVADLPAADAVRILALAVAAVSELNPNCCFPTRESHRNIMFPLGAAVSRPCMLSVGTTCCSVLST